MIRSRYLSTAAIAVLLGAAPAWAQTTPPANSKPLCSELGHPQAGKLADKDTGAAKENSASPVHMDCIPDSLAGTSATSPSGPGTMGTDAASTGANSVASGNATASPSVTGSSSTTSSDVTGHSTDVNSSITGSTSTLNPNIDLRGRSSVTIDNATTTGDQTSFVDATTTTGDQASGATSTTTTGDQSASGSASQASTSGVTSGADGATSTDTEIEIEEKRMKRQQ
jgi:hypothetical protein